jgi:NtrC-family two-component system sensor histidine kinase KinB
MQTSVTEPVHDINPTFKTVQRFSLIIAGLIATTILLGWLIPEIGLLLPDNWSFMKANTALVILLSIGSIILTQSEIPLKRGIGKLFALSVILLTGIALLGHMTGMFFPIDTLLAPDIHSDMPGRMSIQTATFYLILGSSLILQATLNKRYCRLIDILCIMLTAIVLVIVAGYSFQVAELFSQSSHTLISAQTLISSALLLFTLIITRMQHGFFAIFFGRGIGSKLARMAMPFVILIPFMAISMSNYASHSGLLEPSFASALSTTTIVMILLLFMVFMAKKINLAMDNLADAKQQNSLLLDSAGEGILGIDIQGHANFVNTSACEMLGYKAEELIGKKLHALIHHSHVDGKTYHQKDCKMALAFRDGQIHRVEDEILWRKDGSNFPVQYASNPIKKNGQILGCVVVFNDVTERRKLDQLKEEFVSVVSHELRTPLTSIKGSLLMVLSGKVGAIPEKALDMLTIAANNSERLERLINDLLDINKLQLAPATFKPILINELVSQAIESNQGYADKFGVTCVWQPTAEDSVMVMGDEIRLIQALLNLFSNAIKYSPKDKPVIISTESDDKNIRILVSDSGLGIPLDYQDKVFEKFSQADTSDTRQKGGTGLGLAITKEIIEKHSGKISFISSPGQGTTFCIELPINSH